MKAIRSILARSGIILSYLLLFSVYTASAQRFIRDVTFNKNAVTTASEARCIKVITSGPYAGKIMVAGGFSTYNNMHWPEPAPYPRIVRLHSDGTIDNTFKAPLSSLDGSTNIYAVAVQDDGKVIVGGVFSITAAVGVVHTNITRLNVDGSIDLTFNPTGGGTAKDAASAFHRVMSLQIAKGDDGKLKLWVGGFFERYNGVRIVNGTESDARRGGLVITNIKDGSIYAKPFVENAPGTSAGGVEEIVPRKDGRMLICGEFGAIGGPGTSAYVYARRVASLLPNGRLDPAYRQVADLGGGPGNTVYAVAEQILPDNSSKIIIAGPFTTFKDNRPGAGGVINYNKLNYIARLNDDGSLDPSFQMNVNDGFNTGRIYRVLSDSKGQLILGGEFVSYNGNPANRLVRLLPDGGYDATFDIGQGFDGAGGGPAPQILDIAFQPLFSNPEGGILVSGEFRSFENESKQNFFLRLASATVLASTTLHFSVKKEGSLAVLRWNGTLDNNYTIERSSDGKTFTSIVTLSGQNVYTHRDPLIAQEKIYYRLAIRSLNTANQKTEYSPTLSLINKSQFTVALTRLNSSQVSVRFYAPAYTAENLKLSLVNMAGQLLFEEVVKVQGSQLKKVVTLPPNSQHTLLVLRGEKEKEPLVVQLLQ
jgi:hypothetical protein